MAQTIQYTEEDTTAALKMLRADLKTYDPYNVPPRRVVETAIRLLHKLPAGNGELALSYLDAENWNGTVWMQSRLHDAVIQRRHREDRKTNPPKDNRGPERLAAMFRF